MSIKIEFYKHATCSRCKKAKANLERVLEERNLSYDQHINEHDSKSEPEIIDYLRSINILSLPTLVVCDLALFETDPLDLNTVREFVQHYQTHCLE